MRSLVVALLAVVVLAVPAVVLADGRVALVVGNSTYAHIGRLPNPDNDARDMSVSLRRLGFEVTTEFNVDRVELTEALRAFTRRSAGADVSLVFYAGHGIEMDGVNYLVPVDARLERDVDVRFETVTVDDLLVSTSGASLRLVILDACRNNPLARSMQRTAATRTVSGGSFADLNEDLLGDETLVAYAAAAGTTAADGRGRNSPYTAALLSHLQTPLEIGLLFRRVRAQVLAATNGAQRPHEYHSLVGEHYLTRTLAAGASVTVTAAVPADPAPADPPRPDPPAADITELHIAALVSWPRRETLRRRPSSASGMRTVATWCRTTPAPCPGSGERLNKTLPPDRLPLASCSRVVAACGRTTSRPSGGTAVRPNRATPEGRTTSVPCTTPVAGWIRTTGKLSAGTAVRLSRETCSPRTTLASCTRMVTASRGTTRKPSAGIAELQSRETCSRSTISAGCTRTAAESAGIAWRPSAGIVSPPSKATRTPRRLWTVCGEDDATGKGADVRDVSIRRASGRRGGGSDNRALGYPLNRSSVRRARSRTGTRWREGLPGG